MEVKVNVEVMDFSNFNQKRQVEIFLKDNKT